MNDFIRRLVCPVCIASSLMLSSCGILPSGGPSGHEVRNSSEVDIVNATPELSFQHAASEAEKRKAILESALSELTAPPIQNAMVFAPGDELRVFIWTITPWSGSDLMQSASSLPSQINLGDYEVSENGTISLPYVGEVRIGGLGLTDAELAINQRYASLGYLQSPATKIVVVATPRNSIVITGAIGAPKLLPWTSAGVLLSSALTQALGDGASIMSTNEPASRETTTLVSVLRGNKSVTLSLESALSNQITLCPGDRVYVKRSPAIRVTVVGGGVRKNGAFDFGHVPTLSEVLATASGLDANLADSHAVFVLETRGADQRPVLYNFAWDKLQGLIASHNFPMADGMMVYVAEAPIVPVERAINILFQLAVPAQFVK